MTGYRRRIELLERQRLALAAQVEQQRVALAAAFQPWREPAAVIDRGVETVRFFRRYPAILAAALVVAVIVRPRRAWHWGQRAFVVWRAWRALRA